MQGSEVDTDALRLLVFGGIRPWSQWLVLFIVINGKKCGSLDAWRKK
jgi:hypothetical protein